MPTAAEQLFTYFYRSAAMELTTAANATDADLSCPREEESPGCVFYSFVICMTG